MAFSKYGPTMWQGPFMDAFVAGWSKVMHRDRVPELFSIQRTQRDTHGATSDYRKTQRSV